MKGEVMTDEQKLEYIIKYGEKNEYVFMQHIRKYNYIHKAMRVEKWKITTLYDNGFFEVQLTYQRGEVHNCSLYVKELLMSHDFAKCVFNNDEYICPYCLSNMKPCCELYEKTGSEVISWQYHLQQCVISDDYIDYYYQYIKGLE